MKRVLKRQVMASMVLAGILAFSGTAAASSGPAPASGAGFSAASGSQEGSSSVQMSAQDVDDCWNGKLCFWQGSSASGSLFMYPVYPKGQCHNFYTSLDENTSSVANKTGRDVRAYKNHGCSGTSLYLADTVYFHTMPSGWNNTIRAFKYVE